MAQTVIGLDIGTWSIKASVFESTLRGYSLVEVDEERLSAAADGEPLELGRRRAFNALMQRLQRPDAVVAAIPGHRTMNRELELPFTDERKIRSVLGFELEDLLPVDINDLAYDYEPLQVGEDGSRLLCAAVQREWFSGFLDELKDAELDPRIVTLDTVAYAKLVTSIEEDTSTLAIVDIGHKTSSVTVLKNGELRTIRTIAGGGHQLTLALMKGLEVDYASAERIKHTKIRLDGHTPPDVTDEEHAHYLQLISKPLTQIIRDIRLTLHAHANRWQERAQRILFVGGSSQLPGLNSQLQDNVDIEVRPIRLSAEGWTKMVLERDQERSMAMATALGLTHIHGVKDGINFRTGEFASESDFTILRAKAGWLLSMAALFLATFIAQQVVTFRVLEANHAALVAQLETFTESVLGEKRSDFGFVEKRLDIPPTEDSAAVFPEMTAFKAFYAVSEAQQNVNEMKRSESDGVAPGPGPMRPGPLVNPRNLNKVTASPSRAPITNVNAEALPVMNRQIEPSRLLPLAAGGQAAPKASTPSPRPMPAKPSTPSPTPAMTAPMDRDGDDDTSSDDDGDRYQVELKQVQLDLKTGYIKGEANNIEAIEAFNAELKKRPCFESVETSDTTRLSFIILGRSSCGYRAKSAATCANIP